MRISMNLPDELLKEFDECLKEKGYTSRRKGLQDAIKEYIKCQSVTQDTGK